MRPPAVDARSTAERTKIVGFALSIVVMRAIHPDPAHVRRALVILLVVPVIVLVAIGGLCLPFVPSSGAL